MQDPKGKNEEMTSSPYIQQPVTVVELRDIAALAQAEIQAFFVRNPHLVTTYQDRFLAAALCQGAALQYIGRGYGVKDFDIHFFYQQNPSKPRLSRAVYSVMATVGSFPPPSRVDFVRTIVPQSICQTLPTDTVSILQRFLSEKPTANARHLAQKAVVGLLPDSIFAKVIWP